MPGLRGPSALLRLQSDERLIALTRRGQHAAFETLCARYQTRLLSFCRHMLASREDAEDVLQEVYAAAFNAVLADEREINVRPWLYRIARNRSLNHLRRATATGVDSMDVHYAENGISTGEKVLRRESFRELIADVHELPETQRTALLLREIDALSYDQIAQAMETTVPSVKSLLVRARISLAEAAEARRLSCEEVRLELGEAAEGLLKLSTPARRHVRGCERCAAFKKQLKANNHALALIMPVGPLLLVKKLLLAKLGSTASAGGAHSAMGAGATAGATVGAGATAGIAATGGASFGGGLITAGAGALATKAVAGLAAAALVTAGAVAADHAVVAHNRPHRVALASAPTAAAAPLVVQQQAQPLSAGGTTVIGSVTHAGAGARPRRGGAGARHASKPKLKTPVPVVAPVAVTVSATPVPAAPAKPTGAASPAPSGTQVTEVTSEATALPPQATTVPTGPPAGTVTNAPVSGAPSSTGATGSGSLPTAEPVPVPEVAAPPSPQPVTGGTAPSGG
jgi:RNA polymerase sigma factor (sigma-70 family)